MGFSGFSPELNFENSLFLDQGQTKKRICTRLQQNNEQQPVRIISHTLAYVLPYVEVITRFSYYFSLRDIKIFLNCDEGRIAY